MGSSPHTPGIHIALDGGGVPGPGQVTGTHAL
jgi:hypothetical protein